MSEVVSQWDADFVDVDQEGIHIQIQNWFIYHISSAYNIYTNLFNFELLVDFISFCSSLIRINLSCQLYGCKTFIGSLLC